MDTAWIGVIGVLLGAGLGGAIGIGAKWFESNRTEARERKLRMRAGLEELHLRIEQYVNTCSEYVLVHRLWKDGGAQLITFDSALQSLKLTRDPLPILKSLQKRYASEFAEEFAEVLNAAVQIYYYGPASVSGAEPPRAMQRQMNLLEQKCATFNLRIEEKLAGL